MYINSIGTFKAASHEHLIVASPAYSYTHRLHTASNWRRGHQFIFRDPPPAIAQLSPISHPQLIHNLLRSLVPYPLACYSDNEISLSRRIMIHVCFIARFVFRSGLESIRNFPKESGEVDYGLISFLPSRYKRAHGLAILINLRLLRLLRLIPGIIRSSSHWR